MLTKTKLQILMKLITGMTDLEKVSSRLRMDNGCDHREGVDLISIAEKLPRSSCRFDYKEDSLKMVVDWIAENDFLVPNFQVCNNLTITVTTIQYRVCPRLRDSACWRSGEITQPRTNVLVNSVETWCHFIALLILVCYLKKSAYRVIFLWDKMQLYIWFLLVYM